MSELTLDDAIKHCLDIADGQDKCAEISVSEHAKERISQCAADHRQLAEWLTELKELREIFSKVDIGAAKPKDYLDLLDEWAKARKLLKAAVEGYSFIGHITKDYSCPSFTSCSACPMDEGKQCKIWKHEAEALALIGKDIDVPASADDTNVGHKSGGWISCKDRLPEPDTMVIVASYGSDIVIPEDGETIEECCERLKKECVRVTLGFIGSDGWYDCEYCPLIVTPSFWQPLPEPPKDGEQNDHNDK